MLPVLFHIVIPAGFGKLAAILAVVLVAALRALAFVRRARREGECHLEEALVVAQAAVVVEDEGDRADRDEGEEEVPELRRESAEEPPGGAGVLDVVHAPERAPHVVRVGRERLEVLVAVEPAHALDDSCVPRPVEHGREPLHREVLRPLIEGDQHDEQRREERPPRASRGHASASAHLPQMVGCAGSFPTSSA